MAIWDPTTQTGHTQGTPRNWTTTINAQTGTTRTATTSNVNTVIGQCVPGDVVLLSNGNYGAITVSVSGTSTNKIVIVAQNTGTYGARNVNVTAARIIINGSHIIMGGFKYSWGTAQSNCIQLNGDSIELTDCDIRDVTVVTGNPRCVVIDDLADNAYIHHCLFQDTMGMFLIAQDVTYPTPFGVNALITYNTFTNINGYNGSASGGQCVQIGNEINDAACETYSTVSYNKFTNCTQSQFKTSRNTLYRNYFANSAETAFNFRLGDDNIAEGNYFTACDRPILVYGRRHVIVNNVIINTSGSYAIALSEGSLETQTSFSNYQHTRAEDILIGNNVITGSAQRGIHVGKTQTGGDGSTHPEPYSPIRIVINNNIITQSVGIAVFFQNPDTAPNSADGYPTNVSGYHQYVSCEVNNNDIYVTGTAKIGDNSADGGSPTGYISWNHGTLTSGAVISGNIETDPLITSTYRVQSSSPAVNAGVAYSKNSYDTTTMLDWDGDNRTVGAAPDIGVDEFGLNAHTPTVGTWYFFGGQVVALGNPYSNFEMVPGQCAFLFNGNFPLKGKSKTTETGLLMFNGGNQGSNKEASGGVLYFNGGTLSGNFVWSAVASTVTTWRVL